MQDLLGCELVCGKTSGIIVETEAYNQNDAASHSYKGETERTRVMFGPAGYAYIYFTYGMHYCFNVVSGEMGRGEAVLIRALQPLSGIEVMQKRRNRNDDLTNGPAKLAQALGITKQDYGQPLFNNNELFINAHVQSKIQVVRAKRIGISKAKDELKRFYIKDNPYVSKL